MMAAAFSGATAKLNGLAAKARRSAILYSIGAFCTIAAIVFAASATMLALEPHVGVIYARLILAGLFAAVVVGVALALWLAGRRTPAAAQAVPLHAQVHAQAHAAQRSAQFAQLAMIVEAVLLGYSMARRR